MVVRVGCSFELLLGLVCGMCCAVFCSMKSEDDDYPVAKSVHLVGNIGVLIFWSGPHE